MSGPRNALRWAGLALVAAVSMVALAALGYALPSYQLPVLGLVAVLLIWTVGLTDPALVALVSLPMIFLPARLSGAGIDLSVSDLALAAAAAPLLVATTRPFSSAMRNLLWLSAAYQVSIAFTVVANPTRSGIIEWFHEWALVSGALLIGWTLGRADRARAATYVLAGCGVTLALLVSIQGLVQMAGGDFGPVYLSWPTEFHKNFSGSMLCLVALVGYAHPDWSGLPRRAGLLIFWCCTVGMAFTQSRQAIIGLVVGVTILVLRSNRAAERRRSALIVVAAVPVLVGLTVLVRDQLTSGNQFNSANQRLDWFAESLRVWESDYLFGVGLRWWYEGDFAVRFQPPNAELEVLTSAGVVGLIGFLVLAVGSVRVLASLPTAVGSVGLAVVVARLVQGQLDIFWVAGQSSLPYVVAGICVGVAASHAEHERRRHELVA